MTNNETLEMTSINDALKSGNQVLQNNKRKAEISNSLYWGRLDFTKKELAEVNARIANDGLQLNRRKRRALDSLSKRI